MTSMGSPSAKSWAPTAITFSPGWTPTTAIELSWVAPNCTSRRLAVHLPACSCATITANRPGFEGYGTMALRGTQGTGGSEMPLRLMDAIIPGFNKPLWFDTVTSTLKTRFRSSAFGEILVRSEEHTSELQ